MNFAKNLNQTWLTWEDRNREVATSNAGNPCRVVHVLDKSIVAECTDIPIPRTTAESTRPEPSFRWTRHTLPPPSPPQTEASASSPSLLFQNSASKKSHRMIPQIKQKKKKEALLENVIQPFSFLMFHQIFKSYFLLSLNNNLCSEHARYYYRIIRRVSVSAVNI